MLRKLLTTLSWLACILQFSSAAFALGTLTGTVTDSRTAAGQIGSSIFLESHTARKSSMYARYFYGEDRQYSTLYNYNVTATDNDSEWFLAYVRGLTNLRLVRQKYQAREVVPQNQVAATKIFEAMLMGQVTALWGDVPFTEALNSDTTTTLYITVKPTFTAGLLRCWTKPSVR